MSAYIVSLSKSSLFLNHIDSLSMVINIKPVSDIKSVTVYRKLLAVKCIINNKRYKFLRELVRSVIITAVSNIGRKMICVYICLNKHIRGCLACRIWAMRIDR